MAITPTFCCGFECGIATGALGHVVALGTGATFDTSQPISGARSLRVNLTVQQSTTTIGPAFGVGVQVYRFKIRFTTLPGASAGALTDDGLGNGLIYDVSGSKLSLQLNGAALFGITGIVINKTYTITIRVNTTANPWLGDLQVNGVSSTQETAATAANTAARSLKYGMFGANATTDYRIDDVLYSITSGDYPLSPGYVNHFIPTSDGTHNVAGAADFTRTLTGTDILNATTTAYQLLDDVPLESGSSVDWINMVAPPNLTDYVACVFGPAPGINTPTVAPRAVDVIIGYHQAATGVGTMGVQYRTLANFATTVYQGTAVVGVTSVAYARVQAIQALAIGSVVGSHVRFGTDPNANAASVDANPDQYLDCAMIEAEFEEQLAPIDMSPNPSAGAGIFARLV